MIKELSEELYLYNLLRQAFLREPAKEFLQGLADIDLSSVADDETCHGMKLMAYSAKKNKVRVNEWAEELAFEYARLFIGPMNPPAVPYASFYLSESHSLMTDITVNVRKAYLDAGMAVRELHSTPDDHIGIELEFIYYLTQESLKLFETGSGEEALRLLDMRDKFRMDHMALWVEPFADRVIGSSGEDFYKGAADLLKMSTR